MELSIRDWMVVIGVLLLLAVGLDGYRRSQNERKNRVRVSKAAKRRAKQGKPQQDPTFHNQEDEAQDIARLNNADLGISAVDMPSESFHAEAEAANLQQSHIAEPLSADNDPVISSADDGVGEASSYEVDPLFEDPFEVESSKSLSADPVEVEQDSTTQPTQGPESLLAEEQEMQTVGSNEEYQHSLLFETERELEGSEPDEIIVLNVLSNNSQGFSGEDLQHILRACDCRFGEMNIFHRYEGENSTGQVQFSIVNMVEPGVFNLDDIKNFSTPGVSFFLRLPGPEDPVEAYNCMVEVAQCLVRNLDGVLKDDMHSAVTEQTLEHNRQRIRDYQQRELLVH